MLGPPIRSHRSRYNLPSAFPVRCRPWSLDDRPITRLHAHEHWEFGWCREGHGAFHLGQRIEAFAAGSVTIIPPGCYHYAAAAPGTASSWLFIHADPAALLPGLPERHPADAPRLLPGDHLLAGQIRSLTACLERIDDLARTAAAGLIGATVAMTRLPGLAGMPAAPAADGGDLARILELIDCRLGERLGIGGLAAVAGISAPTLTRRFRERLGCSPGQWILERRLERAATLLRQSDLPVAAIAKAVGMPAQSGFAARFRRRHGISPSAWRQRAAS